MHLIIGGRGSLAKAIVSQCDELSIGHSSFDPNAEPPAQSIAVHCSGSGSILPTMILYCEQYSIPLIQASTGQTLPAEVHTVVVDAPNLALPIVFLFGAVKTLHAGLSRCGTPSATIHESHQKSKTSVPGTAVTFAKAMGLSSADVFSIRDPEQQLILGVPPEHFDRHGYHWLTWEFPNLEVEVRTKVHGLRPYALGAIHIARNLLETPKAFENGIHPVLAFI